MSDAFPPPLVVYNLPGPDGRSPVWRIQAIALRSKLADLSWQVELLFWKTGFERQDIAQWILEGEEPTIYRHRVIRHQRYPAGAGGRVAWVTLELRASDISWPELWSVYRKIRSETYIRRQPPSALHVRIHEIVKEWGGIPSKREDKVLGKGKKPTTRGETIQEDPSMARNQQGIPRPCRVSSVSSILTHLHNDLPDSLASDNCSSVPVSFCLLLGKDFSASNRAHDVRDHCLELLQDRNELSSTRTFLSNALGTDNCL